MKREELFTNVWNEIVARILKQDLPLIIINDLKFVFYELYVSNISNTIHEETKDFFTKFNFKTKSNGIGYSINYY